MDVFRENKWSFEQKGDCVWVIHFKSRNLHKCIRVVRGQDVMEVRSMVDLVLVNRDVLRYAHYVRVVRGMGRGLSDHHVILCEVRLVGAWIKEKCGGLGEKLREHQYREGYARTLEGKGVKWEGDNNVEDMWKKVNRAMVESAKRSVWLSEGGGGEKNPKTV